MERLGTGARQSGARVRSAATTTPGQLWLMAALVSVTIAGFAVVAVVATSSRNDSTRAVSTQTEPLLTEA